VTRVRTSLQVYSSQLQWVRPRLSRQNQFSDLFLTRPTTQVPVGSQEQRFAADPPRPVFGDILLAKLKPGQQIDIECRVYAPS
jgi:hypothetical protein